MNARRSMRFIVALSVCIVGGGCVSASAQTCPGNSEALGTSRVLTINPGEFTLLGTIQYKQTLPLKDHEVVITFDDGPLPPYTNSILDTLASQCVKATYFLVGQMAHAYPSVVRRIYNEYHRYSQPGPSTRLRAPVDAAGRARGRRRHQFCHGRARRRQRALALLPRAWLGS